MHIHNLGTTNFAQEWKFYIKKWSDTTDTVILQSFQAEDGWCSTFTNISPVSQFEVQFLILTEWRSDGVTESSYYLERGERVIISGVQLSPRHRPESPLSTLSRGALTDQHRNISYWNKGDISISLKIEPDVGSGCYCYMGGDYDY